MSEHALLLCIGLPVPVRNAGAMASRLGARIRRCQAGMRTATPIAVLHRQIAVR
ncbi:hypothetical protein ACI6Q5_15955 [Xanthomonas codiaei]|uniref:Uncharacterized protein n=1 Tax=Xanthomonas codiaei TaxID=56463 RepID=A0ABW9MQB3_9XANT